MQRESHHRAGILFVASLAFGSPALAQNPNSGPTITGQELIVEIFADCSVAEGVTVVPVTVDALLTDPISFNFNVSYVVDVSATMDDPTLNPPADLQPPAGIGPEDDANGDGEFGTALDAVIFGIRAYNQGLGNRAANVSIVVLGAEAYAADMSPEPGQQNVAAGGQIDLSGNGIPDVEDVVMSLDAIPFHGTTAFSTQTAGDGANYDSALALLNSLYAAQPAGSVNLAFFLSTGAPTGFTSGAGSPLQVTADAGTRVHTFGLGAIATQNCAAGDLNEIAEATGGSCNAIDASIDLENALVGQLVAEIDELTLTVNGIDVTTVFGPDAVQLSIVNVDVGPFLVPGFNFYEATGTASDGTMITATKTVEVSMCMLYVGGHTLSYRLYSGGPLVSNAFWSRRVLQSDVPVIPIPNHVQYYGMRMQMQVVMYNPIDFPNHPFQQSNCMEVVIGGTSTSYGAPDGILFWLGGPTPLGGTILPNFTLLGG